MESSLATLVERIDNLREDLRRLEKLAQESLKSTQDLDLRFSLIDHRVTEIEKRLNEHSSRWWELAKLFIAGFLGGALTLAVEYIRR
jgi:predicted  nucleic acid-binding Zn-ribbon protein